MSREPGRWLVVAAAALTMLLFTSEIAEAQWPATGGGPSRGIAMNLPAGDAPEHDRTGAEDETHRVVFTRPLLSWGPRSATFDIYRSTNGGTPILITDMSCAAPGATTTTCTQAHPDLPLGASYSYSFKVTYEQWDGLLSAQSADL